MYSIHQHTKPCQTTSTNVLSWNTLTIGFAQLMNAPKYLCDFDYGIFGRFDDQPPRFERI